MRDFTFETWADKLQKDYSKHSHFCHQCCIQNWNTTSTTEHLVAEPISATTRILPQNSLRFLLVEQKKNAYARHCENVPRGGGDISQYCHDDIQVSATTPNISNSKLNVDDFSGTKELQKQQQFFIEIQWDQQ